MVPKPPGDAPMMAIFLSPKMRGMSDDGRDVQSIAFLKGPGMLLLYAVAPGNSFLQIGNGRRDAALRLDIGVIEGDAVDRGDLQFGPVRHELSRRVKQRRIE